MRIHKSGDKSVAFFTAYMELLIQAELASVEELENYMRRHFFQHNVSSLGPTTLANFKQALQIIYKK